MRSKVWYLSKTNGSYRTELRCWNNYEPMVPKTFSAILLTTMIKPVVGCVGQVIPWWSGRKMCRWNPESPTPQIFRAEFSDNSDPSTRSSGIGPGHSRSWH